MPIDGWRSLRLGDFVTLQRGHDLPIQLRRPGNVPILGSFGVTGTHDEAKAKGPGVTVGRSGASFGVVSYCPTDYWPLNTALYVIDFHGNDERFAYYFLRSIDFSRFNSGSAQPSLNRNFIHPIPIEVPSFREQRSIAELLGSIDDKIDLNRRMNETLEAMARAIFKSWFVDFDPVRAKMEGRQPVGIDAETAHLFPESFEESLLGLIPSGWRPCSWGDVITLEYGKSLRGYEKVQGDYTVFGTNGAIGRNDEALCQHPGIIVGRKGAYRGVHFHDEPFFVIDTAYYVEPKKPLELRWAYYQMLREYINGMDSGSAIPSTSRDQFYKVGLTYPAFPIQRRFVELLSPLWFRQRLNSQESFTLSAVRDVLLPNLLSGEIRVEHAERMIEGGM